MAKKKTAAITGVGAYLPDYILDNIELSQMVDTSDEWIMSRIGIKTRHILKGEGLGTSFMGEKAVLDLLEKTNTDPMDIEMVICATVTPDMFFPSTANLICYKTGMKQAFGFDLSAACSGFLFALNTASKYIEAGTHKKVIVIGADKCRRSSTTKTATPARSSGTARQPCCWSLRPKATAYRTLSCTRTAAAANTST